jgi:cephalosporin-C deacetylase-like acetyl esterase
MPRRDITFQTSDNVTLRGWLYTPSTLTPNTKLPCLILTHGFSFIKEMNLGDLSAHFVSHLQIACLAFDHRGHGSSDVAQNGLRHEILPAEQVSDIQDAITYTQGLEEIDEQKIGVWGMSYSAGRKEFLILLILDLGTFGAVTRLWNGWRIFYSETIFQITVYLHIIPI